MANYGYSYLAPTPPKVLRRQVAQSVNAQVAPYLSQINRAERQGASQIGVYSDALARQLAGAVDQTRANYGQAEASQAAVNAALANRLSGAGNQLSNDLAGQLAAAGQSTAPSSAVGAIGSGAANAGFASGSASLSNLLAQGAAAQQYAGQLPNLARMRGLQEQGLFQQQQEKSRADILAKVPGLIDSASKQAQANEFQKAVAVQSGLVDQAKLQESSAYHQASIQQRNRAITSQNQRASANLAETQRYHNLSIQARQVANDIAKYRATHPRSTHQSTGPSDSAIRKYRAQGVEAAIAHKHGVYKDSKGNDVHIPQLTAMQTYQYLTRRGMPPRIAATAVGQVYGGWLKPGDKKKLGIR